MHVINCVICTDIFSSDSEIFVTKCGHMFHHHCLVQWLECNQRCPQCRNRTTESQIQRVFVNFDTPIEGDTKELDPVTLQMELEYLQSNANAKEWCIKLEKQKYRLLNEKHIRLRKRTSNLNKQVKIFELLAGTLEDQIKYIKLEAKETSKLKDGKIKSLKRKMRDMEQVQIAIKGSRNQVADLIRKENNIESLALLSASLKTALVAAEAKKRGVEKKLSDVANKKKQLRKENKTLLSENVGLRKKIDYLKTRYKKEITCLKQKVADLDMKISLTSSPDITKHYGSKFPSQRTRKQLKDMKSSRSGKGVVSGGPGGSSKKDTYPQQLQPRTGLKRLKHSSTISSSKHPARRSRKC